MTEEKVVASVVITLEETEENINLRVDFDPPVTDGQKIGDEDAPSVFNIGAMAAMAILNVLNAEGEEVVSEVEE